MKVQVSARHGHLTAEHQDMIRAKAEHLLHYFERLTYIEVTIDLQRPEKVVELIASAEHHHEFVAQDSQHDIFVALNHVIDKVKMQIGHYKQKLQDHRRDPSHGGPEGIHP